MTFKPLKEGSRANWGADQELPLNLTQINTGALLRIADATEAIAKNHVDLQRQRDQYERWWLQEREEKKSLERRIKSMKGVITKLRRNI